MTDKIRSAMLLMRGQCGCPKKLFPAGANDWDDVANAEAILTRATLELVPEEGIAQAIAESTKDCPHEMRCEERYGLAAANRARFGHLDALAYMGVPLSASLAKFGIGVGTPFFPGLLEGTLRECCRLAFGVDVVLDGSPASPGNADAQASVLVERHDVVLGDDGTRAVLAQAAVTALGSAAAIVLERAGIECRAGSTLMTVCNSLRTRTPHASRAEADAEEMCLTLYGTMAAHFLGLDLRIAAVAIVESEKRSEAPLDAFSASLGDVMGSAFACIGEMERRLYPRITRDLWLRAQTSTERAEVVALAADELLKSMLR